MTTPGATWVLVADASGARIFGFAEKNGQWTLLESIDGAGTDHPDQTADFGAKASTHKGALHGHGVSTAKETQERRFAHTLAHVLERGREKQAFARLVLVAPPKLLGELRENLSRGLQGTIAAEVHKDYSHAGVAELIDRLGPELPA